MKYSIVIPCYKSQDFIETAIKSVKEQSFTDYELLVICEERDFATHDAVRRCGVQPIIGDWGSSGEARNVGIELAKGDYILFLDSDDRYLHTESLAMINQLMPDVDVFTFAFIYGKLGYTTVHGNNGYMFPNVWSRVWKRSFIGETRFPRTSRDEDIAFVQKMLEKHPKQAYTDIPFIYYTYPREGSRMQEKIREENI